MRVVVAVVLGVSVSVSADAQVLFSTKKPEPACRVECVGAPGAKGDPGDKGDPGRDGRDGRDGTDGRDGRDAEAGPRTLRPFDLWIRGINFNARAVVRDGAKTYVLVYTAQVPGAQVPAAALVDTATGLAQIVMPFDAGVGPDPAHPGQVITFDDVTVLAPRAFLWWHRGASWSANWNDTLPWQPMPGFVWRGGGR